MFGALLRSRSIRCLLSQHGVADDFVGAFHPRLVDRPETVAGVMLLPNVRRRHAGSAQIVVCIEEVSMNVLLDIFRRRTFTVQALEPHAHDAVTITAVTSNRIVPLHHCLCTQHEPVEGRSVRIISLWAGHGRRRDVNWLIRRQRGLWRWRLRSQRWQVAIEWPNRWRRREWRYGRERWWHVVDRRHRRWRRN